MKYLLLFFLVACAVGGLYCQQHEGLPITTPATPAPAPPSEPDSNATPAPTTGGALAAATPEPSGPVPRQLTPDGVFVVKKGGSAK